MRRFQALLIAAGLAAAPASAVAGPSFHGSPRTQTVEHFEWSTSKGRLGVMVMSLTPELRTHFGARDDRGVLVAHVEPGTPAASAGIAVGDVLVEVQGHKVDGAMDVLSALSDAKKGDKVIVSVVRDHKPVALQATLQDDASALAPMMPAPFEDDAWPRGLPEWVQRLRELMQQPDRPTARRS